MKNLTIRRSTLTKESMDVIENLSKDEYNNDGMNEYLRTEDTEQNTQENNKSQEIDLLWQNFKTTQFNTNSPTAYILLGFVLGVISTLIIMFCIHSLSNQNAKIDTKIPTQVEEQAYEETDETSATQEATEQKVEVPAEETAQETTTAKADGPNFEGFDTAKMKKYVVKDGDTGESIIKKYFGKYTPEKAEQIMKVNNLKSLDRINIDQVLWIPAE